jgi:hypothetical protein
MSYAKLAMGALPEDDVLGRFDILVEKLATYVHALDCPAQMMLVLSEKPRSKRYGFMYNNAFMALTKLRRNDRVALYDDTWVQLGSLTALVWDRIMASPRPVRQEKLPYLTWLLDECVEARGRIVCGNGCTQRLAAILYRLECLDAPHIMSIEQPTSDEQVCFSAQLFHSRWENAAQPPEADIQAFYDEHVQAFRALPYTRDEVRTFKQLLRRFFDMTYDYSPHDAPNS